MKKSIKSVLAKSLAVAMAFSLAGIAPNTSSDAAAKKPTVTKKVSVQVGKTKTVKVTSKKKVKKTTWSLNKAGKKVVSLSKKKAKSVKVKGKKAGKATLTAKIKVGKKTYKKTCKITVTKKSTGTGDKKATPTPTGGTKVATPTPIGGTNTATPTPGGTTSNKVSEIKTSNGTLTIDEKDTYSIALTEDNETTFTCMAKRPEGTDEVAGSTSYNRDGSVSFTALKDYNSGVSYYINPPTSPDQIVDISDTRGDGFFGYMDGTKDMSGYDYIRVEVKTLGEMNLRTYNGNDQLLTAGFPGSATSETYEGGWIHTVDGSIWAEENIMSAGQTAKEEYEERTIFIPITMLMEKGCNPATLTAIAFSPQGEGTEVTIRSIDFVKVKYDKPVTAIEVTSNKDEIELGKTAKVEAVITPEDATRQVVTWSSSDESIATVSYQGTVVASSDKAGEVTITATATDGSGVVGTKKLVVKEPGEEPAVITSQDVDLTQIVAETNPGEGDFIAATATAASIDFMVGKNMLIINMEKYLADNNIDLMNYDELQIKYQLMNEDGTKADAYTTAQSWSNFCLVKKADLNGYTNPGLLKGEIGNKVSDTGVFKLSDLDAAGASEVAGLNIQLSGMDADKYLSITGIKLFKDNNVYVDLSKVKANTNPGEGNSPAAELTDDGALQFLPGGSMLFVNITDVLTENNIDLKEYTSLEVAYQLKNADGTDADAYETAPTWGNFALVNEGSLNGYTNPGLLAGTIGDKISDTATFDLTALDAAGAAEVAGFNFQVPGLAGADAEKYFVFTSITLVK